MVAKVSTIKKKIKQGKKLGFSERARAVNKGLLPSKAKKKEKKRGCKRCGLRGYYCDELVKRVREL